jgi:hypothetical protein
MDDFSRNIDQQLREAYLATTYEVKYLGLQLRIGQENWHLEEFLIDNNVFSWAFISAWNPFSQPRSPSENENQHAKLIAFAKSKQWVFAEGFGVPQNDDWKAEKSLFLLDISRNEAINLGKIFDQHAIVFGRLGKAPELIVLSK